MRIYAPFFNFHHFPNHNKKHSYLYSNYETQSKASLSLARSNFLALAITTITTSVTVTRIEEASKDTFQSVVLDAKVRTWSTFTSPLVWRATRWRETFAQMSDHYSRNLKVAKVNPDYVQAKQRGS